MDTQKIGEYILKKRREYGLTQEDLANKIYVTNKAVSRWENGKSLPEIETIYLLSKALNTNVNEILESGIEKEEEIKEYYSQERIHSKKTMIDIIIFGIGILFMIFTFISIITISLGVYNAHLIDLGVDHTTLRTAFRGANNEMFQQSIPFVIVYILILMSYICYKLKNKKLFYFTLVFTILATIIMFSLFIL